MNVKKLLTNCKTQLPCNCLCYHDELQLIFVGCYSHRNGSYSGALNVFQLNEDSKFILFDTMNLSKYGIFDICAFDLPNLNVDNKQIHAVISCTDGKIRFFNISLPGKKLCLLQEIFVSEKMLTCTAFFSMERDKESCFLCSSLHEGEVHLLKIKENKGTFIISNQIKWKAHEYDAWTVSFDIRNIKDGKKRLWSGGDDGFCYCWDVTPFIENTDNIEDGYKPAICHKFQCKAGVTSIVPFSFKSDSNFLFVGSYDETLYVIDLSLSIVPLHLNSMYAIHIGGGVWRVRFPHFVKKKEENIVNADMTDVSVKDTSFRINVAIAAMQAGGAVVHLLLSKENNKWQLKREGEIERYHVHTLTNHKKEPLVYDTLWLKDDLSMKFVSVSFYDQDLAIFVP